MRLSGIPAGVRERIIRRLSSASSGAAGGSSSASTGGATLEFRLGGARVRYAPTQHSEALCMVDSNTMKVILEIRDVASNDVHQCRFCDTVLPAGYSLPVRHAFSCLACLVS